MLVPASHRERRVRDPSSQLCRERGTQGMGSPAPGQGPQSHAQPLAHQTKSAGPGLAASSCPPHLPLMPLGLHEIRGVASPSRLTLPSCSRVPGPSCPTKSSDKAGEGQRNGRGSHSFPMGTGFLQRWAPAGGNREDEDGITQRRSLPWGLFSKATAGEMGRLLDPPSRVSDSRTKTDMRRPAS